MKVLGFLSFSAAAADWAQPAWRDVLAVSDSDDFYNPFAASCYIFVTERFLTNFLNFCAEPCLPKIFLFP